MGEGGNFQQNFVHEDGIIHSVTGENTLALLWILNIQSLQYPSVNGFVDGFTLCYINPKRKESKVRGCCSQEKMREVQGIQKK